MVESITEREHSTYKDLFPLKDARRFPPYDATTHLGTMIRHIEKGCTAVDRRRVKLKAVKFPRGFRTCERWLNDFITELNTPLEQLPAKAANVTVAAAQQKAQAASFLDTMRV